MTRTAAKSIKRPAVFTVIGLDCMLAISVFLISLLREKILAESLMLGFIIFIVPHSVFAWRSFKVMGAARITEITNAMFAAEVTKFLLTTLLFLYSFTMVEALNVLALFLAYGVIFIFHQCVSFCMLGRKLG